MRCRRRQRDRISELEVEVAAWKAKFDDALGKLEEVEGDDAAAELKKEMEREREAKAEKERRAEIAAKAAARDALRSTLTDRAIQKAIVRKRGLLYL